MAKGDNIEDYKKNYVIPYGISNKLDPVVRKRYEGKPETRVSIKGEDDPIFSHCQEFFWRTDLRNRLCVENLEEVKKIKIWI
ncbi:MAG: hypothetical protein ABEH43_03995, partial [Flavobacteriales bacterium]